MEAGEALQSERCRLLRERERHDRCHTALDARRRGARWSSASSTLVDEQEGTEVSRGASIQSASTLFASVFLAARSCTQDCRTFCSDCSGGRRGESEAERDPGEGAMRRRVGARRKRLLVVWRDRLPALASQAVHPEQCEREVLVQGGASGSWTTTTTAPSRAVALAGSLRPRRRCSRPTELIDAPTAAELAVIAAHHPEAANLDATTTERRRANEAWK